MGWACLLASAAAWRTARAHDGAHAAQPPAGAQAEGGAIGQHWDFTLATLDGDRFVQPARLSGPVLVNFWGRDCAPCLNELPRLAAFAQRQPHWTVLLVSTDTPSAAREALAQRGIALAALRSGTNVTALMRSAGNRSGALPYSVGLRGGVIRHSQLGELSETTLSAWAEAC